MWFLEGKRAVRGLSRRLVDVDHHTGTGGLDIGELESSRRAPRSEQALPAAQDDRIDPQTVLIDEIVAHQCLGEIAASVDLKLPTGLLLQRGDRFRGVPLISVELFHSTLSSVVDATYLGRLFSLAATGSFWSVTCGQKAAKIW